RQPSNQIVSDYERALGVEPGTLHAAVTARDLEQRASATPSADPALDDKDVIRGDHVAASGRGSRRAPGRIPGNLGIYTDWDGAPDTSGFRGRHEQLATLRRWLAQDRSRVVAVLGGGGIGKSVLATKAAQDLMSTGAFDYIFW